MQDVVEGVGFTRRGTGGPLKGLSNVGENMTRSITTAMAVLAIIALTPQLAAAQPRGPRGAEGECRAMAQNYGPQRIWWGRFSGGRESFRFFNSDSIEYHTAERCFAQAADCDAWLYALKSKYNFMPRWNDCRRGYQPGAPVPRV